LFSRARSALGRRCNGDKRDGSATHITRTVDRLDSPDADLAPIGPSQSANL